MAFVVSIEATRSSRGVQEFSRTALSEVRSAGSIWSTGGVGRGAVALANEVERVQNEGPAKRKRLQRAPLSSRRLREFLRGTPGAQSGTPLKLSWGNPSKTHGSQGEERRRRTQGASVQGNKVKSQDANRDL